MKADISHVRRYGETVSDVTCAARLAVLYLKDYPNAHKAADKLLATVQRLENVHKQVWAELREDRADAS